MAQTFDVCIRGAGIVGRTLALLLARERLRVALVAPPQPRSPQQDVRAYALNASSKAVLQSLRCWPDDADATPVTGMQVFGDLDGQVQFDAASQEVQALAWIVDVPALEQRLAEAVRYQPQVEIVKEPVEAALTAVCEGRASSTRAEFGVDFSITPYAQHAIATRLSCEMPHGGIARQWFTPEGILALLPMGGPEGHEVAVVWSLEQALVPEWLDSDEESFTARLQIISQNALGELDLISERATWPLQQAVANRWCGPFAQNLTPKSNQSWVLAGDAAHNVHPLAGQGLNLGLADAQTLARVLQERDYWRSPADLKLLRQYERERKASLAPMGLAMDGLQQLFSRPEVPMQMLRNLGMKGFERSGPLKSWMAKQAMGLL
ncbi:FAD-dependent monooxygenase [Comamonas sp. Y33R10-2]|uniref:FAD-dependent monooxygenase n=1 Tax=Comamonas sp. Y33R10-2 TaxID=2853257 RepID=UPI001C5CB9E3|nr:FAD-dependent monooxygenase [Comamonas sp. Y33R10-2]QXZ09431.1 FAD-dependent monooxygenase [Comamonas sp. Y33R10-2]